MSARFGKIYNKVFICGSSCSIDDDVCSGIYGIYSSYKKKGEWKVFFSGMQRGVDK